MAKRLSKARRQAAFNRNLVIGRAKANDDSGKLQQGAVKCPITRASANIKGLTLPRLPAWETSGKPGKVVKGKFKPVKPGVKQRFSTK